jgi:hypothetical protein
MSASVSSRAKPDVNNRLSKGGVVMNVWNQFSKRLMIVGTLLFMAILVSTPTIGADNDGKLNRIDEESKTTDSEICIAFINSLAAEKAT